MGFRWGASAITVLLALSVFINPILAATDHSDFITEPFNTPADVTKKCLECHEKEAKAFMNTAHWKLLKENEKDVKKVPVSKSRATSIFSIGLHSSLQNCVTCHPGYGLKNADFEYKNPQMIDCLVCHAKRMAYNKNKGLPGDVAGSRGQTDLLKAAQSVGLPGRSACGSCHFYACNGDNLKHGDLESGMADSGKTKSQVSPELDVHIGKLGFTCISCHKGKNHTLSGASMLTSPVGSTPRPLSCVPCHKAQPHKNAMYNKHSVKIACQTCHIPTFAKSVPTRIWWDWSTVGTNPEPDTIKDDKYGMKVFDKSSGSFEWKRNVVPEYFWSNGKVERYLSGEKIDPSSVVRLLHPAGGKHDTDSKIMPFKVMRGKLPFDRLNLTMVFANLYGNPDYSSDVWNNFDWGSSIASGMAESGQPYSGQFDFAAVSMAIPINHQVAPLDKTLRCVDCHHEKGGRLDWKALGYSGDPIKR